MDVRIGMYMDPLSWLLPFSGITACYIDRSIDNIGGRVYHGLESRPKLKTS